jgi:gas vesicle protein
MQLEETMSDHNDNFVKGFLLGGVIGAVLGILFAPKAGREVRHDISEETEKLVNKLKTDLEKAKVTFEESKQKIMEKLGKETAEEPPAPQPSAEYEPVNEEGRKKSTRK